MQTCGRTNRRIVHDNILVLTVLSWVGCLMLAQPANAQNTARRERSTSRKVAAAIKDYGLKDYIRISKDLPRSEDQPWKLVCTMPYNCHFQPWIQLDSPEGKTIQFNSSNPLVLYLTPTETYTTTSGEQTYEAKKWVSGEGAIYTIPAGVKPVAAAPFDCCIIRIRHTADWSAIG